jgi:hypothetical protein
MSDGRASYDFEMAFRAGIGSVQGLCEVCGIRVFGSASTMGYELGELEALKKKERENPAKYQEMFGDDGVSFGQIGGKQFVIGHGCKELGKYEAFIWSYRAPILEYVKKRVAQKKADLERDEELLKGL